MSNTVSDNNFEEQLQKHIDEKRQLSDGFSQKERTYKMYDDMYKQVLNKLDDGILLVQADKIKFANQTAMHLLEATFLELSDRNFSDIIETTYNSQVINGISNVVNHTANSYSGNIVLVAPNSKLIKVKLLVEPILSNYSPVWLTVRFEKNTRQNTTDNVENSLLYKPGFIENHIDEGFLSITKQYNSTNQIDTWLINSINNQALSIVDKTETEAIGMVLKTIIETNYQLPQKFDKQFTDTFEFNVPFLHKYLSVTVYVDTETSLLLKIHDITEHYGTKEQLTKNLQRSELFTEMLDIFNSDKTYPQKFNLILERIGFHIKARRVAILHNTKGEKNAFLYCQYTGNKTDRLNDNFIVPFNDVPSWKRMLDERKMILGFSLQYLPEDLRNFFSSCGISCAYVFPIKAEDTNMGSVMFENYQNQSWDNTEINFMKMVSVLISNLKARQVNEDKLVDAKNKAEESDRLKSAFLANMSHDIRIPMTSIIGFTDLLADPDITLDEHEYFFEMIYKSGQDLLSLVDNIVDMSKIETGQLRIVKDSCSLASIFKELFLLHSKNSKLQKTDILELVVDFADKYKPMPFTTDLIRIKQVFNNLIENAIKFTDAGVVKFGISNLWDKTIEFYVQDTGIGIAEERQGVIFERFSKAELTYTKEYSGTGLGLAICKSIVQLLGGDIRVVSYPGKGSTFYFTHPLGSDSIGFLEQGVDSGNQQKSQYIWESKTIVIVEDVEQNYKYLEYMLYPTKANVIWFKNGKDAVDYFINGNNADAVLMDIRLPVMDGIEATKRIVKISKVPIIAQTAYTLGDEKAQALNAGCIDYVSKPVDSKKLLQKLDGLFKQLL